MLTGVRTKKVIVGADGAAMRPHAPVNGVDGTAARSSSGAPKPVSTIPSRARPAGAVTPAGVSPNKPMSRLPASIPAPQRPAKQGGGF
jgi:hypothetical protein